ncbi:adenylate/guanylate cyclase domain-containing protein [Mycobacterium sp. ACS1612]|uniref:adenylate/guanylate cyclase domain-containing protein n=1 Tax=Mycobacterium sp. ACS1612 TaxID=1834117 RepID=UPI001E3087A1|nr:adenylate/guanylate cyclase domain-containing protein [Mycobacterium sp. ACS1612]
MGEQPADERLTRYQRMALRRLMKHAGLRPGQPLTSNEWQAYFEFSTVRSTRAVHRVMRALPSSPRCGMCGAPFAGLGSRFVRPLGFRPSRKNPNLCATCVELAPPGGITTEVGVMFADLRGFTARSESITPQEATALLRRLYSVAEDVLFPEALIDKLIGDEVMALYLPIFVTGSSFKPQDADRRTVAKVMLEHARLLLAGLGYGSREGPALDLGIGLDYGEAFVGNIGGSGAISDFTAIGDVVNTAARLQGCAGSGEVVVAQRLADFLDEPVGPLEHLAVKGKHEPVAAQRARWFQTPAHP